ncbi:MAG: glycosyltransferase family 2 protein [Sandaracinaceae bacterium]
MRLQCVILNYRTADMTIDAIRAARRALAGIEDHRIDVVDNDSRDGSFEKLREVAEGEGWPDVQVMASPRNGGFGAGNNFAIRKALASDDPPDLVYILNSDAFPAEDAVDKLISFLDGHPDVGIAGSYIHGTDGDPHLTAFRFPTLRSEIIGSVRLGLLERLWPDTEVPIRPMPDETRQVDWLAGASMMLRREVLEEIGLFDETFFLYFEETDLCRRARLAGWPTWYVVESRVAHVGSASTNWQDKTRPMPAYWFQSRRHYFVKNHGRAYTWAANTACALGLASFKLRAALQGKEDPHRVHFFRDFVRFNFRDSPP